MPGQTSFSSCQIGGEKKKAKRVLRRQGARYGTEWDSILPKMNHSTKNETAQAISKQDEDSFESFSVDKSSSDEKSSQDSFEEIQDEKNMQAFYNTSEFKSQNRSQITSNDQEIEKTKLTGNLELDKKLEAEKS